MTTRLQSELDKLLPADFDGEIVIQTERFDGYDLLDPTSNASLTVQKWIDDVPAGAVLLWRPPRRPWVVFVPANEFEGIEFDYEMRFGEWVLVGLGEWMGAITIQAQNRFNGESQ